MPDPQVDDRRAVLEKAFDEAELEANPVLEEDPPADNSVPEPEPAAEPVAPKTDGTPPEPGTETEETLVQPSPEDAENPPAQEPAGEKQGEPSAESQPEYIAPVGWRGAAKQKWGELPKEVQAEVTRREKEIGGVFRESAEARQFQSDFQKTVQPFEGLIASRGSTPLEATRAMMVTQATLMVGTPAQKAQMVAKAIKDYDVDIDQLAHALDGVAPEQAPGGNGTISPEVQNYIQQQLAPFQQMASRVQQEEHEAYEAGRRQAAEDVAAFEADPRYPYLEDLRDAMGDLVQVALRQKRPITLEQAYNMALSMRPDLASNPSPSVQPAPVTAAIPEMEAPETAAARRAAAASSIAPRAQPSTLPEPKTRREAIEQAFDLAARSG